MGLKGYKLSPSAVKILRVEDLFMYQKILVKMRYLQIKI